MKCKNCLAELEEGTLFCPECGTRVDNDADKTVVLQEDIDALEGEEKEMFGSKVFGEPVRQGQADRVAQEVLGQAEQYDGAQEVPCQEAQYDGAQEVPCQEAQYDGGQEVPGQEAQYDRAQEAPIQAASEQDTQWDRLKKALEQDTQWDNPEKAGSREEEEPELCFCPNCGNKVESGSVFCELCGCRMNESQEASDTEKVPAQDTQQNEPEKAGSREEEEAELCFCPNCGNKVERDSVFCEFCGYRMDGSQEASDTAVSAPVPGNKKKSRMFRIIGGVAAVAVIAAAGIFAAPKIMNMAGGGSASNAPSELFYVKDGGIYGVSLKNSKQKPVEYTDDFASSDSIIEASNDMSSSFQMTSKDGKYRFIIEDAEYQGGLTYTLLYKKGKKEPVKIDSGIEDRYRVTPDNKVVYKKTGNLYVNDLKEKKKIASDVVEFSLDKEGKNVLWKVDSGNNDGTYEIYYQDLAQKKDKVKIDSAANTVKISGDLNTILLLKEGSVYLVRNQGDKEKLVSDADYVTGVDLAKGTFFYTTTVEGTLKASDYVEDDMAAADSQITEPVRSDYEHEETAGSGIFSYTRTVVDDAYYDAQDKYKEKMNRDKLRGQLNEMEQSFTYTELYYYANGEKNLITSDFGTMEYTGHVSDKNKEINKNFTAYMIYTKMDASDTKMVKLSGLNSASEVWSMITNAKYDSSARYLYSDGKEVELELDDQDIRNLRTDVANNRLYCLCTENKGEYKEEGNLLTISLNAADFGAIEEKDSDVGSLEAVTGGNAYYLKDVNDRGVGDLYCNGNSVLEDTDRGSVAAIPDSDAVLCLADPNKDKNRGTLVKVKGKNTEKLADDVNIFHAFSESSIAMLTEFSYDRYKGDLRYYNGKDTYLIDSDVYSFFYN